MRYIDVTWKHDFEDEPVRLISEIGKDNFEVRKIEIFKDGTVDYAESYDKDTGTMLGIAEVPSICEINSQDEFQGAEINKTEFDELWSRYCQSSS